MRTMRLLVVLLLCLLTLSVLCEEEKIGRRRSKVLSKHRDKTSKGKYDPDYDDKTRDVEDREPFYSSGNVRTKENLGIGDTDGSLTLRNNRAIDSARSSVDSSSGKGVRQFIPTNLPKSTLKPSEKVHEKGRRTSDESVGDGICHSLDIRNSVNNFENLRGCSVIEGFLLIVLMEQSSELDFQNVSFPLLREITGYFLLYRVNGLKSLTNLFPNLEVIRGDILFTDYALMVYEMPNLQEIGLKKLTRISRGAVRIEKNPALCYTKSLNWTAIVVAGENFIKDNKDEISCPRCSQCTNGHCWTIKHCQETERPKCHHQCLGECHGSTENDCYVCKHYRHEGTCVESCPAHLYAYLSRRCITKEQCLTMADGRKTFKSDDGQVWRPFNGSCITQCPDGYEDDNMTCRACENRCRKIGAGAIIRHISDAQSFRGTTVVKGALEFQIRNGNPNIMNELTEAFGMIEEITEYLKVTHSFPITNLEFFKKLRVIKGEKLDNNNASLVVLDNPNLSNLFPRDQKIVIQNGRLFFHYNPKLCLSKIESLGKMVGITNFTDLEVQPESNGEKVACNIVNINMNVRKIGSNYANLVWDCYKPPESQRLLSYLLSYIETENKNITYEANACGNNSWQIVDVDIPSFNNTTSNTVSKLITDLKPYTMYAIYVKTFTARNKNSFSSPVGQSEILFFRTKSDVPTVPMNLVSYAVDHDQIVVKWTPPIYPNGPIGYYMVSGFIRLDDSDLLSSRDYCAHGLISDAELEQSQDVTVRTPIIEPESCCSKDDDGNPVTLKKCEIFCRENVTVGYLSSGRKNYYLSHKYDVVDEKFVDMIDDLPPPPPPPPRIPMEEPSRNKAAVEAIDGTRTRIHNGTYYSFVFNVSAQNNSHLLDKLRHFSLYTIAVAACGRKLDNGTQLCSPIQYTNARTKKKPDADDVYNVKTYVSNNTIVIVSWDSVREPNGLTVAYVVEYTNLDVKDAKKSTECVTVGKYRANDKWISHYLRNLSPGKYSVRVRSLSLAGDGNFSSTVYFATGIKDSNSMTLMIVLMLASVFACLMIAYFIYLRYQRRKKQERLIASVNPDYIETKYVMDNWEVNRGNVELLEELGLGNFGMVYRGRLNGMAVAVKTISETASQREQNEFLNEASVMKNFSTFHIIKLLGVVSVGSPPLVIMELMENGDLKTYLRKIRDTHLVPNATRVLRMAAEIADGMAYLESKKFVHRDLAARNCMVSAELVCKIGDFGMARDIYETDYYKIGKKGLLPIRWMAPENLSDGVFTSDSDVWSYGVVLYEILTLAEIPYQGFSNEEVLDYVLRKGTVNIPRNCPENIYKLMDRCFKWRPHDRPTFMEIVSELEPFLGQDFCESSFYHSTEGVEIRNLGIKRAYHHAAPIRFHWGNETARWVKEFEDNVTLLDQTRAGTSRGRIFKNGFQQFGNVTNLEDVPLDR